MLKVSVIIPVYNVEKYLSECLDSVINQSLKEIEIICIDDCSTDNSYNILLEYAKKDNRIKLLRNEENKGVGFTRNKAINIASAEYIYFIDPDDYIDLDYIEQLYITAKKYNSDITSNLNIVKIENDNLSYFLSFSEKILNNDELEGESSVSIEDEKICSKEYLFDALWNSIFRRSFIINNKLFFLEIKARNGDSDFYFRSLAHYPKTSYNHKSKYYYRIHSDSIVQKAQKNIEANVKALEHFYNTINYYKLNYPNLLIYVYRRCWHSVYNLYRQVNFSSEFFFHIKKFTNEISLISIENDSENEQYMFEEYFLIKNNNTYNEYILNKLLLEFQFNNKKIKELENKIINMNASIINLKNNVEYNNNWVKFFAINNGSKYLTIYFFGLKISIKKFAGN